MPSLNSHLIIPISVGRTQAAKTDVANALQSALHGSASQISVENKVFSYAVFADRDTVAKQLIQPGDQSYGMQDGQHPRITAEDNSVWLTITSTNDPTKPAYLAQEALSEDMLEVLTDQSSTQAQELEAALQTIAPDLSTKGALLQAVLFKTQVALDRELPREPFEEAIDLSDRGRYIGEVFKVDPVATLKTDPFALHNALREKNTDYVAESDERTINDALQRVWDEDTASELAPSLSTLGYSTDEAEAELREFCEDTLSHIGSSTDLKPAGKVSIDARLKIDRESAYITFDGITSSAYNAVPDESYMAMLDTLKMDVRGWVTYLAESAGLPTPKWDLDIGQFIDSFRHMARMDESTGIHWDSAVLQETMRAFLAKELFGVDADPQEDTNSANAHYLLDIALEVMKARAEELDETWMRANIPDFDNLPIIASSKEWFERFPQISQRPNYAMALANLGSQGSISYDWSNPPHVATTGALISERKLQGILENASYSGDLVIAFDMDLDDLSKLGAAMEGTAPQQLRIDGAYFHIHDLINGAGDGEALDAPISISLEDLRSGKWELQNDACTSYGVAGVFGEFTASDCGIVLEATPEAPKKAAQEELSPA